MAKATELLFFLFTYSAVFVKAQPAGFISIDCGIPEGSNYTDDETGIFYTSDAGFIHSGKNREFPSSNPVGSSLKRQYRTMRSFPEGARNCYTVTPVQRGSRYFMRASFLYVNYDEVQKAPEFDLYVGINLWTTVSLTNPSVPWWTEILVLSPGDFISVCLVNTGNGAPFISALEARHVEDAMYTQARQNQSLRAVWLYDAGSTSGKIIRYPDDEYDRLWVPYTHPSWTSISTSLHVNNKRELDFQPPSAVMQTAATPLNKNDSLYFNWTANDRSTAFYAFRHYAELQKPNGNATFREMNIFRTGWDRWYAREPQYLVTNTVKTEPPMTGDRNYFFIFSKTAKSVLPPILNAFEIYVVISLNETATYEQDVLAMMRMTDVYGLRKNWMGDPCLPNKYLWDGLICNYYDDHPAPRITYLNLSSSGLTGEIDESFGNLNLLFSLDLSKNNFTGQIPSFLAKLTSLTHLDLSDNNLTGTVPEFLAAMKSLTYLNLSYNKLSGSVPKSLVDNSIGGSLTLSVDPNLCNFASCHPTDPCALKPCNKSRSIAIPVVVAVVLASVAVGIAGLIWFKCRKKKRAARLNFQSKDFVNFETRRFSFDEIETMTNNFHRMLGRGGFGTVYHGHLENGKEVAVKVLSQNIGASTQFLTEAQLLMTLYHRHLVRFVGYCADGDNAALILEYMAKGDLGNLLLVQDEDNILGWDQRLHIALDVAQGLEYLHVLCNPPIIHRDVKPANILLNENLEAKLADFGICKVFTDEQHISSTQVKGTRGYLDPEYVNYSNLTEKSDVYSFGVVLLELLTGRSAITQTQEDSDEKIGLVQWVAPFLEAGDIRSIVDPKFQSADYNIASAWRVLELAISCTQPRSSQRPSMISVVAQLRECLEVADKFATQSFSSSLNCPKSR